MSNRNCEHAVPEGTYCGHCEEVVLGWQAMYERSAAQAAHFGTLLEHWSICPYCPGEATHDAGDDAVCLANQEDDE